MALVKLPIVSVVLIAFKASITAPNPPPDATERIFSEWYTEILKSKISLVLLSIPGWLLVAEAAAIIVDMQPSFPLSKILIPYLFPAGNTATSIRITSMSLLATTLVCLGSLVRLWCYRTLGKMFTYQLSLRKDHKLVTTGPYAIVRHPSYMGYILVNLGIFCWCVGRGSWVRESGMLNTVAGKIAAGGAFAFMLFTLNSVRTRLSKEDELLRQEFKTEWLEWQRRAPYMLVPGIY